jgi:hypothetical protein
MRTFYVLSMSIKYKVNILNLKHRIHEEKSVKQYFDENNLRTVIAAMHFNCILKVYLNTR